MKAACEGCERGYCSQRDHSCLMDWEVRILEELQQEMDKVDFEGLYAACLKAMFNTTYNSDMRPDKAKVKEILQRGQTPEYEGLMRRVTGVEFYRKIGPLGGDLNCPLIVGLF